MINDKLRQAGVDVEAMRADAQAVVEAATPPGWQATMLRNPWPEEWCPSCGVEITVESMGVAALTKRLGRPRVLLFTLTIVCEHCAEDSDRLDALAERTFE